MDKSFWQMIGLALALAVLVGVLGPKLALWAENFFALPNGSAGIMIVVEVVIVGALLYKICARRLSPKN